MNENFDYPYMPNPYMPPNYFPMQQNQRIEEEIRKLKYEVARLKERVSSLEGKNKNDYLKNDDGLYMM